MKHYLAPAALALFAAFAPPSSQPLTSAQIVEQSQPSDWRPLDPANTLYMYLPSGRVIIELMPQFAPNHAANIRTLAREHWFDGASINRVQENYVTQWGDATEKKPLGSAKAALAPEFTRGSAGLMLAPIPGPDGYAPEVGFVDGFPAARDARAGQAWPVHCYGMVGAGRGETVDSGSGAELYVAIGHAPRNLDRNITLVGRVIQGMENLTALPRGTGPLGFYEKPEQRVPIRSVRLASELPEVERVNLEIMRTDTPTFKAFVEARANRARDGWFLVSQGFVDLCSIRVPVRERKAG